MLDATTLTGAALRDRRKRIGLSIEALAEHAGLGMGHISLIENNKRMPLLTTAIKISDALEAAEAEAQKGK